MLALTRKLDEVIEFVIPGRSRPIKLRILRTGVTRIKLGIEADSDIEISRPDCPDAHRRSAITSS